MTTTDEHRHGTKGHVCSRDGCPSFPEPTSHRSCSICRKTGHNKSTCPDRPTLMVERSDHWNKDLFENPVDRATFTYHRLARVLDDVLDAKQDHDITPAEMGLTEARCKEIIKVRQWIRDGMKGICP